MIFNIGYISTKIARIHELTIKFLEFIVYETKIPLTFPIFVTQYIIFKILFIF